MGKLFLSSISLFGKLRKKFYILWNRYYLKMLIGKDNLGCFAYMHNKIYFRIATGCIVRVGDYFTFTSGDNFNPLCRNIRGGIVAERVSSRIIIGNHVGISSACIWAKDEIKIGNHVNIGGNCILMDSDAHNLDWRIRNSGQVAANGNSLDNETCKCAPIIIGDHVLIGANSIILKGVTIGEHSVIGAGSVVTRDIPANCIAGGNPCKIIKYIN